MIKEKIGNIFKPAHFWFRNFLSFCTVYSKIQIINVNELPNEEKHEIIPQPLMIRLEHRFTMSDLEELKAAFQVNLILWLNQ